MRRRADRIGLRENRVRRGETLLRASESGALHDRAGSLHPLVLRQIGNLRDASSLQCLDQLRGALTRRGDAANNRQTQELREPLDVDPAAALVELVVHVEHQHHRPAQLGELQRQEEGAPQVLGIGDLNDRGIRALLERAQRDGGLFASLAQIVQTRRVDQLPVAAVEVGAGAKHLHRRAGIVRHRDVALGEVLEQQALPDVRVAYQNQR